LVAVLLDGRCVPGSGLAQGEEFCAGWDHRCWPLVDGVDDFGVVDAAQVGGGDPEVSMTELPLDDHQRDALAAHLDRVGVAELVWGKPAADPGGTRRVA